MTFAGLSNVEGVKTVEGVIAAVCGVLHLERSRLFASSRVREESEGRRIAAKLLRVYFDLTYEQIGKTLGGRDHSTIVYTIQKHHDLINFDKNYRYNYEACEELFLSGKTVKEYWMSKQENKPFYERMSVEEIREKVYPVICATLNIKHGVQKHGVTWGARMLTYLWLRDKGCPMMIMMKIYGDRRGNIVQGVCSTESRANNYRDSELMRDGYFKALNELSW
jgi:hypothetical protein